VRSVDLKNSWLFPCIQSVHIAGIALLVGTITLEDLVLLGCRWQLPKNTARWMRWGLVILLLTGAILFLADVSRYLRNPAFQGKMLLLALALAAQFRLRKGKLAALLSLTLWTCVVLGGRAIADFDIF
jgi:hypothetical protein